MASHPTTGLAGHLLCAVPQLQDPNFRRSVVLMLEHSRDGSLGLVVNSPLKNAVGEVAESLGLRWGGSPGARVRAGGPVDPMRGWIMHDDEHWDPEARDLMPGLKLTTSLDPVNAAGHVDIGGQGSHFLFLLGYAGWSGAQLEAEIAAGSWVVVPVARPGEPAGVSPSWLFETPADRMWESALRSIGVDPGRLVGLKGDVALH